LFNLHKTRNENRNLINMCIHNSLRLGFGFYVGNYNQDHLSFTLLLSTKTNGILSKVIQYLLYIKHDCDLDVIHFAKVYLAQQLTFQFNSTEVVNH